MGKTYHIRKVEGGGVSTGALKKKKQVLVSFPHSATPLLEIIKTPTILSFQAWKLCPVKRGMSETLMEVDLLEEDIDRVGWFLKRKELGCVSEQV